MMYERGNRVDEVEVTAPSVSTAGKRPVTHSVAPPFHLLYAGFRAALHLLDNFLRLHHKSLRGGSQ